jgi:hypothetical protein
MGKQALHKILHQLFGVQSIEKVVSEKVKVFFHEN